MDTGVHQAERAAFNAGIGFQVGWVRHFVSSTTATPPHSQWTEVATLASAGYRVMTSFKSSNSWSAIAAGAENSRLDAIGNHLNTIAPVANGPHVWCFNHEMDNDGDTSANYRAAADLIYPRIKALAPNWKTIIILTGGYTGHPWNDRDPDDYWPTTFALDYLGADYYNQRGAVLSSGILFSDPSKPDRVISDVGGMITKATNHGAKLFFPEFASSVENNAGGPALRAAFIQNFANTWGANPNIQGMCYYEQDQLDGRINWRISGGFLAPEPASLAAVASMDAVVTATAADGWGMVLA